MKRPTGKKKLFCEYYVADDGMNGSAAAIRANYAKGSAAQTAYKFLQEPEILAYIEELKAERSRRIKIDADAVLLKLESIDAMEITDIFNDDFTMKPLSTWPQAWRRYISSFEIGELLAAEGDKAKISRVMKKIKGPDKLKNLEMMGKHVSVNAFRETMEVTLKGGLAERLQRAKQRAKGEQ